MSTLIDTLLNYPNVTSTAEALCWEAAFTLTNLQAQQTQSSKRIEELEACLARVVHDHDNLASETEGRYPAPDAGCIDCTSGTVPNRLNTGRCPFHTAKRLLGRS